jgi:tetratricopeptide (TPR) repeat protein
MGCAHGESYRTGTSGVHRDLSIAHRKNATGLDHVDRGDLVRAERCFRDALIADIYNAPAHNNLGLVLLRTGRLYEAAWEFDYAAKLASRSVEPRQNLALMFEELGRYGKAIDEYEACLEIEPQNMAVMRHLSRAYIKAGRGDKRVRDLLNGLAAEPQPSAWDVWLRGQLIRLGRNETEPELGPHDTAND